MAGIGFELRKIYNAAFFKNKGLRIAGIVYRSYAF